MGYITLNRQLLLLLLLLLVASSSVSSFAAPTCQSGDRAALLAFKAAVTTDPSSTLSTWKSSSPNCCAWKGVTCDSTSGRVTQLDVSQAQLSGKLSPALGALSDLQILSLYENSFTGSIPSAWGNLSQLQQLSVASNLQLTGSIPESFGNLVNLQQLDVSYNKLSGPLPQSIGGMSSLQHIRIYNNLINGPIPDSFGQLSNLFNADLALNQLSGQVPNAFTSKLTNLFFLYLDHNQITGLPKDLSNLKSLQIVYLNGNPLTGLASVTGLATLPKLGELHLSGCHLSGAFPLWVAEIPQLQDDSDEVTPLIDLSNNSLTGSIPSQLGSVANIQSLSLNNNQLSGSLPSTLGNLTSLRFLSLQQNKLSGMIPSTFTQLQSLSSFNVSYNQLSGKIPQQTPFTTFPVSSYEGNSGLCGSPLPACKATRRLSKL